MQVPIIAILLLMKLLGWGKYIRFLKISINSCLCQLYDAGFLAMQYIWFCRNDVTEIGIEPTKTGTRVMVNSRNGSNHGTGVSAE